MLLFCNHNLTSSLCVNHRSLTKWKAPSIFYNGNVDYIKIESEDVTPLEEMQRSTNPPGTLFEAMLTVVSLPSPPHTVTLESGSPSRVPVYRSGVGSPGILEVGVKGILKVAPSGIVSSRDVADSQDSLKRVPVSATPFGVGHAIFK